MARKAILLVASIPLAFVLTVVSWPIASVCHVATPATFLLHYFYSPPVVSHGWGPGNAILIEFCIDAGCWLVVLWGVWWLIHRLRSRPHTAEDQ